MFRADGGRVGTVALEKSRQASIRIPARSSGLAPFAPTAGRFQASKVRFGTRRFRHSPAVAGLKRSGFVEVVRDGVLRVPRQKAYSRRSEYRKPRLSGKDSCGSATSPKMSSLSSRPYQNYVGPFAI